MNPLVEYNPDTIGTQLSEKYQIELVVSIEELEQSSSSFLYKKLIPLYQPAFNDQQRFVFVNFAPVQQSTLDHIVAVLNYIDISPYFVLVITNQKSTAEYFKSLPDPILVNLISDWPDTALAKTINTPPLFNDNNQMCAHAWTGLHVNPNGTTQLCCQYRDLIKDDQGNPYNIKNHSIENITDSTYIKKIRQQFRQGTTPTACSSCTKVESLGGTSKRMLTPYKLQNIYGHINWESDANDSLGFIGGHLGNLCNLKCRICDETYSSSIAAEKLKFSEFKNKKQDPVYASLANSWKNYSEEFYSNLHKLVPRIKNFEFLGGEPLLMQENLKFMQYLIDQGHSQDCIFEFTTNGTQWSDVFDQAHLFKRLAITLSIDDLGKRFEYERSGSRWKEVERNIEKFIHQKNSCASMEVNVNITVNIQNVYYLPELIAWLADKGLNTYHYSCLESPVWLAVTAPTQDAKILILEKLLSATMLPQDRAKLAPIIKIIQNAVPSDGKQFCREMKKLDLIRSESFHLTHPEIATVMGYTV